MSSSGDSEDFMNANPRAASFMRNELKLPHPCPNCLHNSIEFLCSDCIDDNVHEYAEKRKILIERHKQLEAQVNHILKTKHLLREQTEAEMRKQQRLVDALNNSLSRERAQYAVEQEALKNMQKYVEQWRKICDDSAQVYIENLPQWKEVLAEKELVFAFVQEKKDLLRKKQAESLDILLKWFKVKTKSENSRSIMGIEMPDEFMHISVKSGAGAQSVSSALGFICHLIVKISEVLCIPLTMKINYKGSRSFIDNPSTNQRFELYVISEDRLQVEKLKENVIYLDRVIISLFRSAGVPEGHLRPYQMLFNILSLCEFIKLSPYALDDDEKNISQDQTKLFKGFDIEADVEEDEDFEMIDRPLPPPPSANEMEINLFTRAHGYH